MNHTTRTITDDEADQLLVSIEYLETLMEDPYLVEHTNVLQVYAVATQTMKAHTDKFLKSVYKIPGVLPPS